MAADPAMPGPSECSRYVAVVPFDVSTAPPLDPAGLALARSVLDRAADRRRDRTWLAAVWERPDTQVIAVAADRLAVDASREHLAFTDPEDAPPGEPVFLGIDRAPGAGREADGRAVFAVLVQPGDGSTRPGAGVGPASPAAAGVGSASPGVAGDGSPAARDAGDGSASRAAAGPAFATLREIGPSLDDREAGIAVHAIGLANWHATHPHCARCGTATRVADAGHTRCCPSCGAQHFPRSDPAIIVLVTDGEDRVLLGRHPGWPPGRFSTLAGFVEPGESLEAAVRREVLEETGVVVGPRIRYAGSQPWPFPSSLMLGFYALAASTEIEVDGDEISEARWLTRDDLAGAIAASRMSLPGAVSISRRLLETWYGTKLPDHW